MKSTIKFGTDGWRALIAKDFTFENVSLTARAVAEVMKREMPGKNKMVIGYDRRFLSRQFAELCATTYAENGFQVLLGETYLPTPAVSWCAKFEDGVCGATMITASHNPPEWNGFKFKETFGGSARPELTGKFEEEIRKLQAKDYVPPSDEAYKNHLKSGTIRLFNPMERYVEAMKKHIDIAAIRKLKTPFALDVMYGSGSKHFAALLTSLGLKVEELHAENNPGFNGTAPEPIGKNLQELCALVKKNHLACGLATDGDADRFGAVDENGEPFTTQMILSVVYWHMLTNRKKRWNICRSASTTKMVDLIAERAGLKCHETPVGFKFIADKMIRGEASIGGEESGGIGLVDHIPERDGLATGLLLLEVMATTGKGPRAVYEEICKEYRPYYFERLDIHLAQATADASFKKLETTPPTSWEGRKVATLSKIDGFKFYMEDGSWLLIRKSGTEPIFRLYAEAETTAATSKLVQAARKFVE